jgi:PAS domain S-box-containing protein
MTIATKKKGGQQRLAEDKYFNLIEHAADGIAIIQDRVFKLVNTALTQITGYDKKELLGMPFTKLLTPPSQKLTMARYQARLAGKKVPSVYEVKALTKTGETREIEINAALTEYDGRTADEVIIRDITERKKAEEALRESEDKYKTLAEDSPIGIYFNDFRGTFLYGNKKAEEITGYKREELLGQSFLKLKLLAPKELAKAAKLLALNKLGKATGPDQFELNRKDGTKSIVEIRTRITTVGGKKVVLGMVEDITERKKAEETLRRTKEQFETLWEESPFGVSIIKQDGRYQYLNPKFVEMFGYTLEDIPTGREWFNKAFPDPEYRSRVISTWQTDAKLSKRGEVRPLTYTVTCKDGSEKIIQFRPIALETGDYFVIYEDITERTKAEQALADEATQRHILVDQSRDGIVVLDQNGKVYEANRRFADMLGYTPEETAKLYVWDWEAISSREQVLGMLKSVDEAGDHFETRHRRKDGTFYDVEISTNGAVVAGQKLIFCVCRDITGRKKAEAALRESQKFSNSLLENSPNPILVINPDTSVRYVNPAFEKLTGFTPAETTGRKAPYPWWPQRKREEITAALKDAMAHGGRKTERNFQKKNGESFWAAVNSAPVLHEGKPIYFILNWVDITERKRREQLQQGENYVLTLLGEGAELSQLLDAIVRLGEHNDPSIKGSVLLLDPSKSKEFLFQVSAPSLPDDYKELFEEGVPIGPKAGSCGTAAYRKERVIITDIAKSPLFKPYEEVVKRAVDNGLLAVWSQPIIASNGNLLGTIANYSSKVGEPSADDLKVLEWSARVAAIAIERKKAEEALQAEKNKLQSVIGAIEYDLTIQDKDFNVIYQNEASRRSSGGDQLGEKCYRAYENRENICPGCPVKKAFKDGKSHTTDRKRVMPSGEVTLWENTANPIRDAQGNIISCLEIGRNITERKKMEQQLQEKNEQLDAQNEELKAINEELRATEEELQHSQERLERMFESVTDGIIVAALDGTILKVNQSAVQMHGFATDDEILGKNANDLVAPADRERISREMIKAQEKGATRYQECNLLKADGSEFPTELSTSALKDASGQVIGHITIVRDVTERKQMEKLFKTVTNSSQVGIYIIQHGKFRMVNPQFQKLTGYTAEELLGRDSLDLVLPEDRDKVREEAIKMLKGERTSPYQFRVVNKARESRWVMITVTSIPYQGGRATLGNYMDITERRQTEERERQLQQELNLASRLASIGQLAAGVAHEINNPLTGVIGFSHLMLNRDIPDDIKQDLKVINSEAQRVAKIVENLLVFAHQRKTGREQVNINETLTRVLELRAYEMKVNNIELETQLDPELPLTMADAGQLQQVFLNIALNAEHFMARANNQSKLAVKTEKINGNIRVSFTDNGTGISPENLDKIFNPFFTTKEVGKGTGLGLSICHSIITQHQGRIYAQSQPGKGATFIIELPIVAQPAQPEKAKETKKEPQKPRGAKILVVDDEEAILTFLSRLLTEWGHSVETVNNANTALERLKTERYSLILLDIKLPGMSGIELYRHIEETVPALTRRVMFITGDIMEATTREFLEKAKVAHITKPLDIEVLKKMINRALNQTQAVPVASG